MKVELINENKVKITLSFDELKKRKISFNDIQKNTNILLNLIEELDLDETFTIDDTSNFMIETTSDNNKSIIVTITKIEDMPELKKYSLLETKKGSKNLRNSDINYKVNSNIYCFDSLDAILDMCNIAKQEKLFFGKNSLYKYNNLYYIIFSPYSTKNIKFLKTFVILSEYCKKYYSLDMFSTSIKEKSKLIIENNALQTLSKI